MRASVSSMVISPRISFSERIAMSRAAAQSVVGVIALSRSSIVRAERNTEPRRISAVRKSMIIAAFGSDRKVNGI